MLGHKKMHTTDRYMKPRFDAQLQAAETVTNVIADEMSSNIVRLGGKK